jgi:hypothetical protein
LPSVLSRPKADRRFNDGCRERSAVVLTRGADRPDPAVFSKESVLAKVSCEANDVKFAIRVSDR